MREQWPGKMAEYNAAVTSHFQDYQIFQKQLISYACQLFGLGSVCYWVCLFLGWWLCLVFGLCVCGLVVKFGIWFVCCLVGG